MSEAAKSKLISLVGMMGAGKTTVGALLAKELGWDYLDNDAEIESQVDMSIAQIFKLRGEEAFREMEADGIARAVGERSKTVFSVGGGAIVRPDNREVLRTGSYVIWLQAPVETLTQRVMEHAGSRPMVANDPVESMRRLYEQREPIYRDIADLVLEAGTAGPERMVESIVESLK